MRIFGTRCSALFAPFIWILNPGSAVMSWGMRGVCVDIYSCPHRGKHMLSLPTDSIRQLTCESEGQI